VNFLIWHIVDCPVTSVRMGRSQIVTHLVSHYFYSPRISGEAVICALYPTVGIGKWSAQLVNPGYTPACGCSSGNQVCHITIKYLTGVSKVKKSIYCGCCRVCVRCVPNKNL